ncbi:unnamed protein product [Gadus morhua 'NCC']
MIHNHDSLKNPGLLNSLVSRDAGRAQRLRQELPSTGVAPAALLTTPWCRECLPEQWFCGACDTHNHSKQPLHNRDSVVDGFLKAIPHPHVSQEERLEYMPHMSKSGQINGDALQRSFLEFAYASFEEDQLCCDTPFTGPACTPVMV